MFLTDSLSWRLFSVSLMGDLDQKSRRIRNTFVFFIVLTLSQAKTFTLVALFALSKGRRLRNANSLGHLNLHFRMTKISR